MGRFGVANFSPSRIAGILSGKKTQGASSAHPSDPAMNPKGKDKNESAAGSSSQRPAEHRPGQQSPLAPQGQSPTANHRKTQRHPSKETPDTPPSSTPAKNPMKFGERLERFFQKLFGKPGKTPSNDPLIQKDTDDFASFLKFAEQPGKTSSGGTNLKPPTDYHAQMASLAPKPPTDYHAQMASLAPQLNPKEFGHATPLVDLGPPMNTVNPPKAEGAGRSKSSSPKGVSKDPLQQELEKSEKLLKEVDDLFVRQAMDERLLLGEQAKERFAHAKQAASDMISNTLSRMNGKRKG